MKNAYYYYCRRFGLSVIGVGVGVALNPKILKAIEVIEIQHK